MLKTFIGIREAALRLRDNQDGVVSFEYVIVAACLVAAVAAAFGTGGFQTVLEDAIKAIGTSVTSHLPA